jgi:hypothetical protein
VSPQLRRFAPFILIALVLLFVLPLIRGKSSSGLTDGGRSTQTLDALAQIDKAEKGYLKANGRYTASLADLLGSSKGLASDLAIGIGVQLDVSTDGKTYVARLASSVLSLVRARTGTKLIADDCLTLKSSSGVKCPVKPATPTGPTGPTGATTTPSTTGG